MGYWLVIMMALCAAAIVLLAMVAEPSDDVSSAANWTSGRLSLLLVVDRRMSPTESLLPAIQSRLPVDTNGVSVEIDPVSARDRWTSAQLQVEASEVDVLVIWMALSDLLAGVSIGDYERSLANLLRLARSRSMVPVVGGLPDLATWSVAEEADLPIDELIELTWRWNAAIARHVYSAGGVYVDLSAINETDHDQPETIARAFLPGVHRALILAQRRAVSPARQPV